MYKNDIQTMAGMNPQDPKLKQTRRRLLIAEP
jgi:hypothetical protein